MSERKTIKINPEIFGMGNNKTKKVKEKKPLPSMKPLITPNTLKNKLLKRIKEHKENENNVKTTDSNNKTPEEKYSDEFFDLMNYLSNLSKQKKLNDEKENYEKKIQRKREELQRKTVKNYNSLGTTQMTGVPLVQLDLPDELKEPVHTPISFNIQTQPYPQEALNLKYKVDNEVPYGVLKGGYKPTYKALNRTVRNYDISSPSQALTINTTNTINQLEREKKLNRLKEKIKEKQELVNNKMDAKNIINENVALNKASAPIMKMLYKQMPMPQLDLNINTVPMANNNTNTNLSVNINSDNNNLNNNNISIANNIVPKKLTIQEQISEKKKEAEERFKKEIVKRTIRRKYKLGKSKSANKVSILIKDRNTRKNILNAQKELKKKPLSEVKSYLHNHGLIKVGSNAPNDILRKMYEYSMLSGEINNNSSDVLLHNYLKEKDYKV